MACLALHALELRELLGGAPVHIAGSAARTVRLLLEGVDALLAEPRGVALEAGRVRPVLLLEDFVRVHVGGLGLLPGPVVRPVAHEA